MLRLFLPLSSSVTKASLSTTTSAVSTGGTKGGVDASESDCTSLCESGDVVVTASSNIDGHSVGEAEVEKTTHASLCQKENENSHGGERGDGEVTSPILSDHERDNDDQSDVDINAKAQESEVGQPIDEKSCDTDTATNSDGREPQDYKHGLREGDHVIRWKMLGFCYPIQIHGIVLSAGPDIVTIVDCGLTSSRGTDKVGNFEDDQLHKVACKPRKRLSVLTLVDDKAIKKWTKVNYGEEVQLRVHSSHDSGHRPDSQQFTCEDKKEQGSASLDCNHQEPISINDNLLEKYEREESTLSAEDDSSSYEMQVEEARNVQDDTQQTSTELITSTSSNSSSFWCFSTPKKNESTVSVNNSPAEKSPPELKATPNAISRAENNSVQKQSMLRLPQSDPSALVLARVRFLLEFGEESLPTRDISSSNSENKREQTGPPLLPPHHLLYCNSECIAVWCKTGHFSTLQASVFLHSSTIGNAKQTATLAMFLSAQTVTVPASGIWGFFGGTTTVSLFSTQPWLVPALVGGGMVYVGLPMVVLWKAKGRWHDAEKRLNDGFWRMAEPEVFVELIRSWSSLEC